MIEIVRRVLLAEQIAGQYIFACPVYAFTIDALNPYSTWQDRWLSRLAHIFVLLSTYLALLLKIGGSDEASSDQDIFSVVLVATHVLIMAFAITECITSVAVAEWKASR